MNGFLFDENLPSLPQLITALRVFHVREALNASSPDTDVWEYAKANDLVIVTKDADFSDRIIVTEPPPRVVHLRIGNMRLKDLHSFLQSVWTAIEVLLENHKMVIVFADRLEGISSTLSLDGSKN